MEFIVQHMHPYVDVCTAGPVLGWRTTEGLGDVCHWNSSRATGFYSISVKQCCGVSTSPLSNSILLSCSALLLLLLISSCCKIPVNDHTQFSFPRVIMQLGLLISACEWIVGFSFATFSLLKSFSSPLGCKSAWKLKVCVAAPELKEEDFSPQYITMCTSAHEPQTCKQLSWLVSEAASLYFLWHYYNLLDQFRFQWMILILLHYLCGFSPWDIGLYLSRLNVLSSVCPHLKALPRT